MAALGALIQATMAGEPLGLLAVNVIGFTVRVSLNLNFEPAVSIKEPALPSWGGFDSLAGFSSPFSYTRALSAVVLPAAFSVIEPYLFSMDNDFDSCGQHDSPASSSGPSSAAGSGGMGNHRRSSSLGHGGQWRCPQGSSNGRRGRSASGDGRRGGGHGDNNGNGNNRAPTPPPTRTVKDDPATATTPPRPMAGGAPPPPPPPPPPGFGALLNDDMDNINAQSFIQVHKILMAGIVFRAFVIIVHSKLQSRPWYNAMCIEVTSFFDRIRRAARLRYTRSLLAAGYQEVLDMISGQLRVTAQDPLPLEVIPQDQDLVTSTAGPMTTDLIIWEPTADGFVVEEDITLADVLIIEKPVVDEHVSVQLPLSTVFAINESVAAELIPLAIQPVNSEWFTPHSPLSIALGVLLNLFVDVSSRLHSILNLLVDVVSHLHSIVNGFIIMDLTPKILLVTVIGLFLYYYILIREVGIVHLDQGVDAEEFMARLQAERHRLEDLAPVEHQGGIPITEMEFRPGYRTRRRKRCRKKKGSTLAPSPVAVESSTSLEDDDSRSLANSMWAV